MARQRKEDAEATRKRILDAARSCFLQFGFSSTSMEMIASHAGNTRGAIYWHFKSKEHILSVLTELELAPWHGRLRWDAVRKSDEPLKLLRYELLKSLREFSQNVRLRDMFEVLLHAGPSASLDGVRLLAQRGALVELHTLERVLQRADELGQLLQRTNVTVAARSLYTGISGVLYGAILDPEEFSIERDGELVLDAFLLLHAPIHALYGPEERSVVPSWERQSPRK
ncbi:TetR family transcriptional regulator [Stenotrophomonas maltophilia]|uniref:TetR family transcriptional regulator n=1 Tax=Stenotrophomonas maltophilia group TaxID=995085 RepID=UPI00070B9DF7|nr:TetR family transcriptional regulator [Stenotrophomonas maltophilia]KRG50838.1 hypothetical protein ARC02_16300 [Stenotrophomonas maltophilia]NNH47604.1 TetR family transcriptional regulator [Stenotrophomonas maltophilia]